MTRVVGQVLVTDNVPAVEGEILGGSITQTGGIGVHGVSGFGVGVQGETGSFGFTGVLGVGARRCPGCFTG
jgi:hypothetical protein